MDQIEDLIKKLHQDQENNNNKKEQIELLYQIALCYYENNEFEKSKLNFKKILKLDQKKEDINYHLALIELKYDNYSNAQKYLNKELKIDKNNLKAKIILEKLQIQSNFPLITLTLIILNSIVFYFTYPQISKINLIKYTLNHINFDIITPLTSLFFHVNLYHFLSNIIILLMFGLILEKNIGSIKFLTIYLISGYIGNLIQSYLFQTSFVLGASCAIFGIIGSLIMIKPLLSIRVFGILKMPIIILFGAFFIFSNMINNFISYSNQISSANIGHLSGFIIGLLITGTLYSQTIKIFYHWLIISCGFYILNLCINKIINLNLIQITDILQIIIYFIVSLITINYSYQILKKEEEDLA